MDDSRLTLIAEDAADLPPLSALLQDALLASGDMAFDRRARRLVLLVSRYRWEAPERSRVRCGLRIGGVIRIERRQWPRDRGVPLDLLALTAEGDTLLLDFAGGAVMRMYIECIDIVLEDLSAPWPVRHVPAH